MKHKIIITFLIIIIIGLSSYIVYDKLLKEPKNDEIITIPNDTESNEIQSNNNEETNNSDIQDDNLLNELSNIFKHAYEFYDWGNAYCGSYNTEDMINPEETDSPAMFYYASSTYNSFDEMITDLKKYMTEHVIYGKHYMGKDNGSYIEQDGKLYCANFGKGGNVYFLDKIDIQVTSSYDTVIYTSVTTTLKLDDFYGDSILEESYDITFSKLKGVWVISSYQKITN